jgi:outer membrane translocation and assembly module TamA
VLAFLSLERYKDRDDLDAETVDRLQASARRARSARRCGPSATTSPKVTTEDRGVRQEQKARDEGQAGRAAVRMAAVRHRDARALAATSRSCASSHAPGGLKPGRRLSHAAYERHQGQPERTAAAYGYLDAQLTASELAVDVERSARRARSW